MIRQGQAVIREAELRDVPQMADIYNDAILHTTATFDTELKGPEDRTQWFREHTGRYLLLVCEERGAVVGYASLSRYRERKAFDKTVELSVYIHREHWGKGIGRSLMTELLSRAEQCDGIETVVSLVTSENAVSIHLHEALGFSYCGQIRNAGEKFGRKLHLNAYQIVYEKGLKR